MKEEVTPAFHELTLRDPLFAAEGMDVENAAASLDALERALADLEPEYADGSFLRKLFFTRYPLGKYAIPLSFLRGLLASEKARRSYVESPSLQGAHALLGEWERTARALAQDARHYHKLHEMVVRMEFDPEEFVMQDMFGHLTSYRYVEKLLDALQRNAEALGAELTLRRKLLKGEAVSMPPRPAAPKLPALKKTELSEDNKRYHEAEIAGGVSPYRYADIIETHGPYAVELASLDETPREHTCIVYLLKEKETGRRCMWPAFVDKYHFIDIWHMVPKDDGVTRGKYATAVGLQQDEIPFWYEGIAFLYNTRDTRYWMDIAASVDRERRPELDWDLAAAQKSSLFDLILAECARDTRTMIAHLRRRKRSETAQRYSLFYDLLTRTYPAVYYMPFNASVWRLHEEPPLIGDGFEAPPETKFLSEERMRKELTPEVLAKVMSVARLREERGKAAGWLP